MDFTVTISNKELEQIIKDFLKAKNLNSESVSFNIGHEYHDNCTGSVPALKGCDYQDHKVLELWCP